MKKLFLLATVFLISEIGYCQTPTTAEVRAELAKYPTVKTDLCSSCLLWKNPYYKSIGDTVRHMPVVVYEVYTKSDAAKSDNPTFGRESIFAAWHSLPGQPNEDNVYSAANDSVKKIDLKDEIAKGHVQPWVLNRFNYWAAIFSNVYTFNAGHEHQGQNVGTEIATENLTRILLKTTDTVRVWGGCFVDDKAPGYKPITYTDGKVIDTQPTHYWKIIKYNGITLCYWMPNLKTETRAMLKDRMITYDDLVSKLGFDPEQVLK